MSTFHLMERPNSRTGDKESQTRRYVATGSNDEVGVRLQCYSMTPPAIMTADGFMYRQNIVTDEVMGSIIYLSVIYGKKKVEEGNWSWTADGTGGTLHIKVSKASVARYPGTAKDHKQLIGVNGDEVAGSDIVYPTGKITVSYTHPQGVFSLPYFFAVNELTGTCNSAPMLTRPAGEILFMGPRGSDGTDAPAQVDYTFAHQKNLQDIVVGAITDIQVDGWDVSWIAWKDNDDDDIPGKAPLGVYVERVYTRVDHATLLGFGG